MIQEKTARINTLDVAEFTEFFNDYFLTKDLKRCADNLADYFFEVANAIFTLLRKPVHASDPDRNLRPEVQLLDKYGVIPEKVNHRSFSTAVRIADAMTEYSQGLQPKIDKCIVDWFDISKGNSSCIKEGEELDELGRDLDMLYGGIIGARTIANHLTCAPGLPHYVHHLRVWEKFGDADHDLLKPENILNQY